MAKVSWDIPVLVVFHTSHILTICGDHDDRFFLCTLLVYGSVKILEGLHLV